MRFVPALALALVLVAVTCGAEAKNCSHITDGPIDVSILPADQLFLGSFARPIMGRRPSQSMRAAHAVSPQVSKSTILPRKRSSRHGP